MECEENGKKCYSPARAARGVKRKRRADDEGNLRLPIPDTVPGSPTAKPMHNNLFQLSRVETTDASFKPSTSNPFMNNMDEISYWVFTKRAPCLYDYDKLIRKQNEEAQNSRQLSSYTYPTENEVPSPKKKKKNNKLLDEESVLSGKRQNVYFETPQPPNIPKAVVNNGKSVSPASDIDFNIKITPKLKAKKPKLQKNTKTTINKRNKMVTSTPKVEHQNLRRSSRLNKQNLNNNGQFDSSLDILNETDVNGLKKELSIIENKEDKLKRHADDSGSKTTKQVLKEEAKNDIPRNGDYEDYSDVSGFTANYIRSTKLQSKTPRKVRRKSGRNLIQASRQNVDPESSKIVMCVNKAVNVGAPNSGILNHSTDSSQNVINLVTVATEDKSNKVNQSTSLLKFVDSQCNKPANVKKITSNFINESFQSGSSAASRYPKRITQNRNHTYQEKQNGRKENSHEKFVYRTRSRKRLIDDSCEQVNSNEDSSNAVINVASPEHSKMKSVQCFEQNGQLTKSLSESRHVKKNDLICDMPKCIRRLKTSLDKTKQSSKRDSLRDKSGFAACFSDSDSDGEPLKPRKFFS
ncbi:spindle assembly checkpoint component MAD1-like [Zerene cesonia]|uniref:spindle assembly checkpoint component MAD1-like n=1 Tax=Zerene cesonia TaxID=33412 RepID=UPI0018E59FB4|nr:spindle assembly checkpoint component MAD1-like [Zerene cesonia]